MALQLPGFNAILADERGSFSGGGSNDTIKTGRLFPGCIYGRVGSARESTRFIRAFHLNLESKTYTLARDAWADLEAFAENFAYSDDPEQRFTLVISSRISGTPRFYTLESGEGLRPFPNKGTGITTFGSGRAMLDSYVAGKGGLPYPMGMSFIERIERAQSQMLADGKVPEEIAYITPYMLCLWLTELTINYERTFLEADGVGGVFHHLYQTASVEAPPWPALYIFTRPEVSDHRGQLHVAWFRTAYVGNGLYVERFVSAGFDSDTPVDVRDKGIVLDVVSRPDLIGPYDEDELYRELDNELQSLPYAYFVGIGHFRPDHRARLSFFLPAGARRNEILDEDGRFNPYVIERIKESYPGWDFGNMA